MKLTDMHVVQTHPNKDEDEDELHGEGMVGHRRDGCLSRVYLQGSVVVDLGLVCLSTIGHGGE